MEQNRRIQIKENQREFQRINNVVTKGFNMPNPKFVDPPTDWTKSILPPAPKRRNKREDNLDLF